MFQAKRFLMAAALVAAGCGSAVKGDAQGGGGPKIAGGGEGSPKTAPYEAPAFEFTPKQHGPHGRAAFKGPGDLSALPPVKFDFKGCYGTAPEEEAQIAAPSVPAKDASKKKEDRARAGGGGGGGGGGGYAAGGAAASKPSTHVSKASGATSGYDM